jgi:hypothetical protein
LATSPAFSVTRTSTMRRSVVFRHCCTSAATHRPAGVRPSPDRQRIEEARAHCLTRRVSNEVPRDFGCTSWASGAGQPRARLMASGVRRRVGHDVQTALTTPLPHARRVVPISELVFGALTQNRSSLEPSDLPPWPGTPRIKNDPSARQRCPLRQRPG